MLKSARTICAVTVSLALVFMVCGCAMFQRGPSDEQLLSEMLAGWVAAMGEGSVEKVMSFYSKNYVGGEGEGYDELEELLEQIVPALEQFDAEFKTDGTTIEIEGSKATLAPITLESSYGTIGITIEATKEGGAWLITSTELEQ